MKNEKIDLENWKLDFEDRFTTFHAGTIPELDDRTLEDVDLGEVFDFIEQLLKKKEDEINGLKKIIELRQQCEDYIHLGQVQGHTSKEIADYMENKKMLAFLEKRFLSKYNSKEE